MTYQEILKFKYDNPDKSEAEIIIEVLDQISPGIRSHLKNEDIYIGGQSVATILYAIRETGLKGEINDIDIFSTNHAGLSKSYGIPDNARIVNGAILHNKGASRKGVLNFINYKLEHYDPKIGQQIPVNEFFDINAVKVSVHLNDKGELVLNESKDFKQFLSDKVLKVSNVSPCINMTTCARLINKSESIKGSSLKEGYLIDTFFYEHQYDHFFNEGVIDDFNSDILLVDAAKENIFTSFERAYLKAFSGEIKSIEYILDAYKLGTWDSLGLDYNSAFDRYDLKEKEELIKFYIEARKLDDLLYRDGFRLSVPLVLEKCFSNYYYKGKSEYKDILINFFNDEFAYNPLKFKESMYYHSIILDFSNKDPDLAYEIMRSLHDDPDPARHVFTVDETSSPEIRNSSINMLVKNSKYYHRLDQEKDQKTIRERAIHEELFDEGLITLVM